jgi:hypothetical protein
LVRVHGCGVKGGLEITTESAFLQRAGYVRASALRKEKTVDVFCTVLYKKIELPTIAVVFLAASWDVSINGTDWVAVGLLPDGGLLQINRDNVKWALRMGLILVLVAVADGLVVAYARKPFPWDVLIPCALPVLMSIFVLIPMMKAEKSAPPSI